MFYAKSFSILPFNSFIVAEDKFFEPRVWEEDEGQEGGAHDEKGH